ncbi:phage tail tape measure protein, partial [Romboutsia sp.]|uniref:phage tail tape measure protein n=1 Tax=Romboutsia sp. TaxID=1965302 RepID=UPI002B592D82
LELTIKDFINNAKKAQDSIKSSADNIKNSMNELQNSVSENASAIGESGLLIGGGLATAGGIVTSALLDMADGFEESEKTLNKFGAQTGKTGKELESFQDSIKDSYLKGYGDDLEQVTQAFSDFSRELGTTAEETQALTEKAFQLNDIYDYDINDTLKATGSLMKNMGIDGTESMDLIAKVSQVAGDRADDLLDTINEYSARFAEAGFSAEEMANILIKGAQAGARDYDTVADAIKEANILLTEGGDAGEEALTKILGSGKKAKDMMESVADGSLTTGEAMKEIVSGLSEMDNKTEQANSATAVFGTLWEEVGLKGLQAMTDNTNALGDYNGTLDEANGLIKEQGKTMEQVTREFEEAKNLIGAELAPILSKLLGVASKVILKLVEFGKANPILTKIVAIGGTVISVLGTIAGVAITVAGLFAEGGVLAGGVTALGGVLSSVGGVIASVVGAIVSAPVLIGVAIVGLIALIIWKWEEIKTFTVNIWTAIWNFIKAIPENLKMLWNNFLVWLGEFWNRLKLNAMTVWNSILDFVKSIPGKLLEFFTNTLPYFIGYVIGRMIYLGQRLNQIIIDFFVVKIPAMFSKGWQMIINLFTVYIPRAWNWLGKMVNVARTKLGQWVTIANQKAKAFLDKVILYVKQLPGKIASFKEKVKEK